MKKNLILILFVVLFSPIAVHATPANPAFKNDNFYQCVVDAYNTKNKTSLPVTTNLTDAQLKTITSLYCYKKEITDASGIEKMTLLTELRLPNNQLTSIDVSKNTELTYLDLYDNQLTSIDLSKNTELTYLDLSKNQLKSIDLSKNPALDWLALYNNQLTSIDLSKNTALTSLNLTANQLASIDLSNNTALKQVFLNSNQLTNIDLSYNTVLRELLLSSNALTNLDLSENTTLTSLYLGNNQITSLDLRENTLLTSLYLGNNQITSLDLSNNTALSDLSLSDNQLTSIDLSKNPALDWLALYNNQLTSIDLSKNTELTYLDLSKNQLISVDLSKNTALDKLYLSKNQLTSLDLSNNIALEILNLSSNSFKATDSYLFNGGVVSYTSGIVLPSNLPVSNVEYKTSDGNLASVDMAGIITAKQSGNVTISYLAKSYSIQEKMTVHISDLTSNKYQIDKNNGVIDMDGDMKVSTVLANLSPLNGQVFVYDSSDHKVTSGDIQNGYKIKVENDGHVVKIFTPEFYSYGTYQDNISGNYFILNGKVTGNDIKNQITLVNKTLDSFQINNGSKSLDSNLEVGDTINLKVSGETINLEVTDILIGDVNGDHQVSIADCVYIAKSLLGEFELNTSQRKAADFNNDGSVNIADCVAIAQKLLE